MEVLKAFEVLGCSPRTQWQDVERAYRRHALLKPRQHGNLAEDHTALKVDVAFNELKRYFTVRSFDIENEEPAALAPPCHTKRQQCLWCPHQEAPRGGPKANLFLVSLAINSMLLAVGLALLCF